MAVPMVIISTHHHLKTQRPFCLPGIKTCQMPKHCPARPCRAGGAGSAEEEARNLPQCLPPLPPEAGHLKAGNKPEGRLAGWAACPSPSQTPRTLPCPLQGSVGTALYVEPGRWPSVLLEKPCSHSQSRGSQHLLLPFLRHFSRPCGRH